MEFVCSGVCKHNLHDKSWTEAQIGPYVICHQLVEGQFEASLDSAYTGNFPE